MISDAPPFCLLYDEMNMQATSAAYIPVSLCSPFFMVLASRRRGINFTCDFSFRLDGLHWGTTSYKIV